MIAQVGFNEVVLVEAFAGGPDAPARTEVISYQRVRSSNRRIRSRNPDRRSVRPSCSPSRGAAKNHAVDLILMATHRRDGIGRWRLGSFADEVVREARCPTLLIGPNVKASLSPYYVQRILVPVDGSPLAEGALPVAARIAKRTGASLDIVQVALFVAPTSVWVTR
jgi:hypothetical protein